MLAKSMWGRIRDCQSNAEVEWAALEESEIFATGDV